jgi:hypothetical protein
MTHRVSDRSQGSGKTAIALHGLGRLKHLELELEGEQWGGLLYD